MTAFPVNQIDPLSPSAVQNTMGIASNNNATAERGSRERMQTQALAQDSAEKAKYQQFLGQQQQQQLAAQAHENELNRQMEERHAQRQEDLMRELKAVDLELDASRDEADAITDENAEAAKQAKGEALRRQQSGIMREINARQLILDTSKAKLSSIHDEVGKQIDARVTEKTTLNTNLATESAKAVSDTLLKLNADKNALYTIARPTGISGAVDVWLDALKSPIITIKKDMEKTGSKGPLGAILSAASAVPNAMEGIPDEQRRDIVISHVFDELGTKVSSLTNGGEAAKKAITTLAGGITAMGVAATPESKQAAQQIISDSVKALKESGGGSLDDYTIHTMMKSVVDALDKQATEVGVERKGLGKSESDRTYKDVAKGFKDASNLVRATLDNVTTPSARSAANPAEMKKSYTLAEGFFNVQNDPENADAHIKAVAHKLLTPDQEKDVHSALDAYRKAAAELPALQEQSLITGDQLTSGSYMGTETRNQVATQKRSRAAATREIANRFRTKKKDTEE